VKRAWILFGFVALVAIGGLVFAYLTASKERVAEGERDKPMASESQVSRDTNGETTIRLEPENQKRLALESTALLPFEYRSEMMGYGRVLDSSPLAALVAELTSDRAAAQASRQEFERLKTLSAQSNASARALQAAQSTALRDQVQVDSVYQRLLATWGKTVAERKDLTDLVQSLVVQQSALVRVDLLTGDVLMTRPEAARLLALADESNPVAAQFVSQAPTVDPQSQGQGLLFLVMTNESRFAPGAALTAYLADSGRPPMTGVEIPRQAVVRFNGRTWIYFQTGEEEFIRREVGLEQPTTNGWFVSGGIKPGARVVVRGAQMLLSEEQKFRIQAGD